MQLVGRNVKPFGSLCTFIAPEQSEVRSSTEIRPETKGEIMITIKMFELMSWHGGVALLWSAMQRGIVYASAHRVARLTLWRLQFRAQSSAIFSSLASQVLLK